MSKHNTRSTTMNKNGEQQSDTHTSNLEMKNTFNSIDEENPTIKDIFKVLKGMSISLNSLAKEYEESKGKIQQLENENKILKVECEQLNNRLNYIETDYYTEQQLKLQQYLTIHGVPQQKNNELVSTIIKIGETLNVKITPENIKSHRTINNKNRQNSSPIIVIELNNIEIKKQMQINFKNNGPIIAAQILKHTVNTNKEHQKIYINDYLCTHVKKLLEQTKKIQQKCNLKFVWSKNGSVYARRTEEAPIIKIRNFNDIKEIEKAENNQ